MDAADATALGEDVTRLEWRGREIFLVGTAHVSRKSVEHVRELVRELRPDAVCVELDQARYDSLVDESRFRSLDVSTVLSEDRAGQMLASLLFAAFQKRLGDRLGVRPGAEMLAGVEEAKRIGARVVLADRDVQTTLRRCYASLGALDRLKVVVALSALPFAAAEVDEAEVERLKNREAISDAMSTFAEQMPALEVPLITERDQYLVDSTRTAEGRRIVSIVGAAHVAGMVRYLDAPIDRAALVERPPPRRSVLPAVVPVLSFLLVALAFHRGGVPVVEGVLLRLLSSAAAGGALAVLGAGGHVVTALVAAVLSPTLVFPPFPYSRIVGRVQAAVRRPTPDDAGVVRGDMLAPARLRKNPFLAALLTAVLARLGRAAFAVVGLLWAALSLLRAG
ncbi:MAG TPA: TraB family protein [Polyangiaceae bacterium]|nr:TraB family protein [Polyangiaceae bacterium]